MVDKGETETARDRETHTDTQREKERHTQTQRDTHTETQTHRETTQRYTEKQRREGGMGKG